MKSGKRYGRKDSWILDLRTRLSQLISWTLDHSTPGDHPGSF